MVRNDKARKYDSFGVCKKGNLATQYKSKLCLDNTLAGLPQIWKTWKISVFGKNLGKPGKVREKIWKIEQVKEKSVKFVDKAMFSVFLDFLLT